MVFLGILGGLLEKNSNFKIFSMNLGTIPCIYRVIPFTNNSLFLNNSEYFKYNLDNCIQITKTIVL